MQNTHQLICYKLYGHVYAGHIHYRSGEFVTGFTHDTSRVDDF
jgi:hypothetical protein